MDYIKSETQRLLLENFKQSIEIKLLKEDIKFRDECIKGLENYILELERFYNERR